MFGKADVAVTEVQHFKEMPSVDAVKALAAQLPNGAFDILSVRGNRYQEMGLKERSLTEAELIQLLAEEPGLWRRPVVTDGKNAVVGYNQKALQALLDEGTSA